MKIAVVWVNIPNYIGACLNLLADYVEELLVIQINSSDISNKVYHFEENKNIKFIDYSKLERVTKERLILTKLVEFNPNFILLSFYNRGIYYKIAKICSQKGIKVIGASDAYYKNTWRQNLRILVSKFGFHKYYDAIFVPGFRARQYAQMLSFKEKYIIDGLYTCDDITYKKIANQRFQKEDNAWPHVFLYVGQLNTRKGIDNLLEAYKQYRLLAEQPWELWLIGGGPLKEKAINIPGVSLLGHLSSEECSKRMENAGTFILASEEDHWPLVIHEAASAGLPIIATSACGSTVELVQDFYNGLIIPSKNVKSLVHSMIYLSQNDERAYEMGKASMELSNRYSVKQWAKKVVEEIPQVINL